MEQDGTATVTEVVNGAGEEEVDAFLFPQGARDLAEETCDAARARYIEALKESLDETDDRDRIGYTLEQAHGIGGSQGVRSISLVHMNRLRAPLAALVGVVWGYPAEPLTGDVAPCPIGPGVKTPINSSAFPVPLIILNVPVRMYGQEMVRGYEGHGRIPANRPAVELVQRIRRWLHNRGACLAAKEAHGVMGCVRAMFSYRVDAEAMKAERGLGLDDLEAARTMIKNGSPRVEELAANSGRRAELDGREAGRWLKLATVVDTGVSATGQTCAYGISVHERATEFTVDPRQFLVMASRTREFTVMIMPVMHMRTRGGREVNAFLDLVVDLGWMADLDRTGLD